MLVGGALASSTGAWRTTGGMPNRCALARAVHRAGDAHGRPPDPMGRRTAATARQMGDDDGRLHAREPQASTYGYARPVRDHLGAPRLRRLKSFEP
jgi:hypothetical protein